MLRTVVVNGHKMHVFRAGILQLDPEPETVCGADAGGDRFPERRPYVHYYESERIGGKIREFAARLEE